MDNFELPPLKELMNYLSHAKRLGLQVIFEDGKKMTLKMPYHSDLEILEGTGYVAHGAVAALVDTAFGMVIYKQFLIPHRLVTLDLRIDYMGKSDPRQDIYADVICTKLTREVAFVNGEIYSDGKEPFALAIAAFSHSSVGT